MFDEDFVPIQFIPSKLVTDWHKAPRIAGSTDTDFSQIASLDNSTVNDYVLGSASIAFILAIIFGCWLLVFIAQLIWSALRCKGPKSDGQKYYSYPRILFISFAGLGAFCIALYLCIGLPVALDALESFDDANSKLNRNLEEAQVNVNSLQQISEDAISLRDVLLQDLDSWCPNKQLVEEVFDVDIEGRTNSLSQSLTDLSSFIVEDITGLSKDLETAISASDEVSKVINDIENDYYMSVVYVMAAVMFLFLLCAVFEIQCCRHLNAIQKLSDILLVPSVALVALIAVLLSGLLSIAAVLNSDYCGNDNGSQVTPSNNILPIMTEQNIDPTSYFYRGADFYLVKQCQGEFPFDFLLSHQEDLKETEALSDNFVATFNSIGISILSALCGADVSEPVTEVTYFQNNTLSELDDIIENVIGDDGILTCTTIIPIYDEAVFHGVCDKMMESWHAAFCVMIVLAFIGCSMLTLYFQMERSANKEDLKVHQDSDYGSFDQNLSKSKKVEARSGIKTRVEKTSDNDEYEVQI